MVNCGFLDRDILRPEQIFNTISRVDREIDTRVNTAGRYHAPLRFMQHPAWTTRQGPYNDPAAQRTSRLSDEDFEQHNRFGSPHFAGNMRQTSELNRILFDPRQTWDNSDENTQHE